MQVDRRMQMVKSLQSQENKVIRLKLFSHIYVPNKLHFTKPELHLLDVRLLHLTRIFHKTLHFFKFLQLEVWGVQCFL